MKVIKVRFDPGNKQDQILLKVLQSWASLRDNTEEQELKFILAEFILMSRGN